MPFNGPVKSFGATHPISAKDTSRLHQLWSKSLAKKIPRLCIVRGWNLERRHSLKSTPEGSMQRKFNAHEKRKNYIPSRRWNS